ncbi:retrovirus-related pol polyprotein from transposon TNT 1-94 [Tanacetum coccineum]
MHNNIMAAGFQEDSSTQCLGPGRIQQGRSRFLWYIDTKPNGEGLKKSILSGPYIPSTVLVQAVASTERLWISIGKLRTGESMNVQDVKTNSSGNLGRCYFSRMENQWTEQGVPLQAEQADWLADTDEEIDEQELEAHYSFMAKIQEVLPEEIQYQQNNLETESNEDDEYVKSLEKEFTELESEKADFFKAIYVLLLEEVLSKGMLQIHLDSFSTSKYETPKVSQDFLTMIQRNLQAQVISCPVRDRGTKFLNKTLHAYFKEEGIEHQTSTPRTPE